MTLASDLREVDDKLETTLEGLVKEAQEFEEAQIKDAAEFQEAQQKAAAAKIEELEKRDADAREAHREETDAVVKSFDEEMERLRLKEVDEQRQPVGVEPDVGAETASSDSFSFDGIENEGHLRQMLEATGVSDEQIESAVAAFRAQR